LLTAAKRALDDAGAADAAGERWVVSHHRLTAEESVINLNRRM
jgi:hypothetical protein